MKRTEKTIRKLIIAAMAIMLIFGAVGCKNSNPLTDPMNPMNPNSPLNPNNQNRFTASKATSAIVDIINGLDKEKLSEDLNKLKQAVMTPSTIQYINEENTVAGMSLTFTIKYNDGTYNSIATFIEALENAGVEIDQENPSSAILYADSVTLTLIFSGYTNGVKGNVEKISSDSVVLSGNVDETAGGTAPFDMEISNLTVLMKEPAGTIYTITNASNMAIILVDEEDFMLPPATHNASFTINDGKNLQSVTWNAIVMSEENETPSTSYTELMPDEAGIIGYYDKFGTQHFLLALYEAFGVGHNELIIENKDNITVEEDDTFTMTLKLKDYTYARNNAPQKANETVVLRFIGGSDSEESDIFKTNSFTVYSDGAINLSSDEYKDATVTYGSTSAPVEVRLTSPSELSLEFKTYTDEEGGVLVTGIKYYGNEGDEGHEADFVEYEPDRHSFTVDDENASKIVFK